jgi:hypothetical protein
VKADSSFCPTPDYAVVTPTVPVSLECGTTSLSVNTEGVIRRLNLYTGSKISILQPGISNCEFTVTTMKPHCLTAQALDIERQQSVTFEFESREFRQTFLVCTLPTNSKGLLGTDFIEGAGAFRNFERSKISIASITAAPRGHDDPPTRYASLTMFTQGKERRSPQPSQKDTIRKTRGTEPAPAKR